MKETNYISQLMLERYHRGKVTNKERKFIEREFLSNKELVKRYEYIKKSDEEIRLTYPLENLPRLYAVRDSIVEEKEFIRDWPKGRIRLRSKRLIMGISAAAVLLIVFVSLFYFTKERSVDEVNGQMIAEDNEIISEEREISHYDETDEEFADKDILRYESKERETEIAHSPATMKEESPAIVIAPGQPESGVYYRGGDPANQAGVQDRSVSQGDNPSTFNFLIPDNRQNEVVIPDGVASIGNGEYAAKQITKITIPNSVTSIGNEAFANNRLRSVTIPNSVNVIGSGAFRNNQLTSVAIPNRVTAVEDNAFANNQLANITFSGNVAVIGAGAFRNNSLTSITIPDSVITIDSGAFYSNQLTSVTIGSNVEVNDAIPGNFANVYNNGGRAAGTYTRADTFSDWRKR
jgi:hypothetical protein